MYISSKAMGNLLSDRFLRLYLLLCLAVHKAHADLLTAAFFCVLHRERSRNVSLSARSRRRLGTIVNMQLGRR